MESLEMKINSAEEISDKRRLFEILAVILTGGSKILFINILELHAIYIVSAILFWVFYFVFRVRKQPWLLQYWGLTSSNLWETFRIVGTVGGLAILLFLGFAILMGNAIFSWNLLFVLLTYPFWGLVQQFVMMSIVANNLNDFQWKRIGFSQVIIITSFVFAIVHYPSIPLIIATFFMALFYSFVFLKKRNIIPLGFFHGILGGLFYYLVLEKDTWEILLRILHL